MTDEIQPAKRKYTRCEKLAMPPEERLRMAAAEAALMPTLPGREPAAILEVRLTIPPDMPGMSGTTSIDVADPKAKAKGLTLSLHRIGVLATYADGSFVGVFPYSQIKRIRFDRVPE